MDAYVDNVRIPYMPTGQWPLRDALLFGGRVPGLQRPTRRHRRYCIHIRVPSGGQRDFHADVQRQTQDHGHHIVRRHGRVLGRRHRIRKRITPIRATAV